MQRGLGGFPHERLHQEWCDRSRSLVLVAGKHCLIALAVVFVELACFFVLNLIHKERPDYFNSRIRMRR
ncbi:MULTISPECIES: hypothetical protein [Moorena]|uniref:hypothetical protein n=1 Tax=Moorena TaxID=1155738 RepID=UPI0010544646|nr:MULTISPECIES: hypothetical protein [Moorena]NER91369.1 hypothetical protein [Moorena sp. SIO3A2]